MDQPFISETGLTFGKTNPVLEFIVLRKGNNIFMLESSHNKRGDGDVRSQRA